MGSDPPDSRPSTPGSYWGETPDGKAGHYFGPGTPGDEDAPRGPHHLPDPTPTKKGKHSTFIGERPRTRAWVKLQAQAKAQEKHAQSAFGALEQERRGEKLRQPATRSHNNTSVSQNTRSKTKGRAEEEQSQSASGSSLQEKRRTKARQPAAKHENNTSVSQNTRSKTKDRAGEEPSRPPALARSKQKERGAKASHPSTGSIIGDLQDTTSKSAARPGRAQSLPPFIRLKQEKRDGKSTPLLPSEGTGIHYDTRSRISPEPEEDEGSRASARQRRTSQVPNSDEGIEHKHGLDRSAVTASEEEPRTPPAVLPKIKQTRNSPQGEHQNRVGQLNSPATEGRPQLAQPEVNHKPKTQPDQSSPSSEVPPETAAPKTATNAAESMDSSLTPEIRKTSAGATCGHCCCCCQNGNRHSHRLADLSPKLEPKMRIPKYEEYRPSKNSLMLSGELVRERMRVGINAKYFNQRGAVYVYTLKGHPGYLKIGQSKYPFNRLKRWEKCGFVPEPYREEDKLLKDRMRHYRLVERLAHAELFKYRYRMFCPGCSTSSETHTEWFRTTPAHAWAVIKRFSEWLEDPEERYSEDGQLIAEPEDVPGGILRPIDPHTLLPRGMEPLDKATDREEDCCKSEGIPACAGEAVASKRRGAGEGSGEDVDTDDGKRRPRAPGDESKGEAKSTIGKGPRPKPRRSDGNTIHRARKQTAAFNVRGTEARDRGRRSSPQ